MSTLKNNSRDGAALLKDNNISRRNHGKIDLVLLLAVCALSLFGILMVYSASSYSAEVTYGDKFFFLKKQVIGVILGGGSMAGLLFLDYNFLKKLKYPAIIISVILLALVFVPGLGVSNYGARRWVGLPGMTIQPSEFAKFGFVLFAAAYMAEKPDRMKTFAGMIPVLLAGGAVCVLIILEPNMSITMCVGLVMLIMLFVGGARLKHFLIILLPALALIPVLILMEPYRLARLTAFLNPWASPLDEGYQLIQSFYALGSGGWFGVGLFNSRQKYNFLPFAESDFIFSIIGEELGFVGCIIVLIVFVIVIARGVKIAWNAPDRFAGYLAAGIVSVIAVQLAINIAVVTGSIPPTGLPLPFISAGGSSLVVFMGGAGILLNISRRSSKSIGNKRT